MAKAKCNKHIQARYTVADKSNLRENRQQLLALSTQNIFLFPLTLTCEKTLLIYTTEHCKNIVNLTKILGSWLSLCAWTCICTVILIRYCVVIFLFFLLRSFFILFYFIYFLSLGMYSMVQYEMFSVQQNGENKCFKHAFISNIPLYKVWCTDINLDFVKL